MITAKRLQFSKTAFCITMGETLHEAGLGPAGRNRYDVDAQMAFEADELMEKWQEAPEWTPLTLDEPNRPAGARRWHTPGNQALAEWVQTRAFQHRPTFFPLPHQGLLDNAICDVCTSHGVVQRRGFIAFYEMDPDMLNRKRGKVWTPKMGTLEYRKPYDEDWAIYLNRRIEYAKERGPLLIQQAKQAKEKGEAPSFNHDALVQIILSNPNDFTVKGKLSPTRTMNMVPGVSYGAAQQACDDVNRLTQLRDRAENAS